MLDEIEEHVYTRLPNRVQPVAQKWFYVLNPRLSWQYRKKPEEVDETFVDRFFADTEAFEQYRNEFRESAIGEICMEAESETPDGYTVFDAHRKDVMKYYTLVRKFKPDAVVETGVYNGVLTAAILLALDENDSGHLYSVDYSTALRPESPGAVTEDRGSAGPQGTEATADEAVTDGAGDTEPVTDGAGDTDPVTDGAGDTDPVSDRADNTDPTNDRADNTDPASDRAEYYERGRPSCSEPGSSVLVPGKAPGWILPDWLRERWTLREGRSQAELPKLRQELDEVDVFVHDSEHSTSAMLYEFEFAWEWLAENGLVLSSHIQWNDAFDTFVEEHDCEAGLTTFHYLGYEGEKVPCSTGYVRKP